MSDIAFTFGIVTNADGGVSQELIDSVTSIRDLKIPEYQIIIIGNQNVLGNSHHFQHGDIKLINFDESQREGWITRKKNIITDNASYENVVYMHDYILLKSDWYDGFKTFGDNFDVCVTKLHYLNEEQEDPRHRDWLLDYWNNRVERGLNHLGLERRQCLIPYEEKTLTKYMYINGGYWVAKKSFMQRFRLNETLSWGQGEDVEWSCRARKVWNLTMNTYSTAKLGKNKHRIFDLLSPEDTARLRDILK